MTFSAINKQKAIPYIQEFYYGSLHSDSETRKCWASCSAGPEEIKRKPSEHEEENASGRKLGFLNDFM